MTVSRNEFEAAVAQRADATQIEKQAKKLSDAAREVILSYWSENPDEFEPEREAEKTVRCNLEGLNVRITVPKGADPKFDQERADELRWKIIEAGLAAWVDQFYVRTFSREKWEEGKERFRPKIVAEVDAAIEERMLPGGREGSPRVEVGK